MQQSTSDYRHHFCQPFFCHHHDVFHTASDYQHHRYNFRQHPCQDAFPTPIHCHHTIVINNDHHHYHHLYHQPRFIAIINYHLLQPTLSSSARQVIIIIPIFSYRYSELFSGHMAKYAKYAYLGAYLGAHNMVKWGVPEKILQNAVQICWS